MHIHSGEFTTIRRRRKKIEKGLQIQSILVTNESFFIIFTSNRRAKGYRARLLGRDFLVSKTITNDYLSCLALSPGWRCGVYSGGIERVCYTVSTKRDVRNAVGTNFILVILYEIIVDEFVVQRDNMLTFFYPNLRLYYFFFLLSIVLVAHSFQLLYRTCD